MRQLLIILGCVFLFGCETSNSTAYPGRITKERAVAIAMEANRDYPVPLSKVTRTSWRPDATKASGGYWAIDFKDADENFGKFYLVDGKGNIVGRGRIDEDYYH